MNCVFCRIVAGQSPATILYKDEKVTAFFDDHPIAPVHILVVPNHHLDSVKEASVNDEPILGHLIAVARHLAEEHGIGHSGYRMVINTGPDAGQSIFHLHLHLIGGRYLPFNFR